MMQQSLEARFAAGANIDAFAIGGGTYSFPRYFVERYTGEVLVAEIDPEVTDVARDYFGLSDDPRIRIDHEDARIVARELDPDEVFDVAFADAFRDSTVPYQLTTSEFNEMIASHLKPDGLYFASLADGHNYDFLRSYIRTLRLTFPNVGVLARSEARSFDGINSNFVVVASNAPLEPVESMLSPENVDEFMRSADSVVLTDNHAPVEQLLAPAYR
jgi:spermidine synthase